MSHTWQVCDNDLIILPTVLTDGLIYSWKSLGMTRRAREETCFRCPMCQPSLNFADDCRRPTLCAPCVAPRVGSFHGAERLALGSQPRMAVQSHSLKVKSVTTRLCAEACTGQGQAVALRGSLRCTGCKHVSRWPHPGSGSCRISEFRK